MMQRDKLMQQLLDNNMDFRKLAQRDFTFKMEITPDKSKGETEEQAQALATQIGKRILSENNINTETTDNNLWNDIWANIDTYLNEFLEELQEQRNLTDNTIKNMNSGFQYLRLFCVEDTIPNLAFYKKVQKNMKTLPYDFLRAKKWRGKSWEWIKENLPKKSYKHLNPATINKHINFHIQFFEWLEYNDIKYKSDMNKIKALYESDIIIKEEYETEDLAKIFRSDLKSEFKDFCLVALFTGLRLGEISKLTSKNINQELNFIEIFSGKTKNAERAVPIHTNIKDILYSKLNRRNGFLFFEGNTDANGKKLNRALNKIIEDEHKTFHSFRKTFSQSIEMINVAEEKYIKFLMGHSNKSDITMRDYNLGKINYKKLSDIIDNLVIDY